MSLSDPFGWVGHRIDGRFAALSVAGHGAFGIVYRGEHLALGEPVAIKCLKIPAELGEEQRQSFLEAFRAEARLLHRLSRKTAAIVQALDLGAATSPAGAWTPYIVMEWLEGETLESELSRRRDAKTGPRTIAETLELLRPAADALAIAHAENVAHRDTKPGNLFLVGPPGSGTVKVLDFGIAKVLGEATSITRALVQSGTTHLALTPRYAAPEQFDPTYGTTGPWTDVFALALLVIELASGTPGLEGTTVLQLLVKATQPTRPSLAARGVDVPEAFEAVLQRALAVEPKQRHGSAGELWEALERAATTPGASAPRPAGGALAEPAAGDEPRGDSLSAGGENRICAILVAELSGLAELSERLEPEEVNEIVERCFAALAPPIQHYGGSVDKLVAGRLLAVFGIPRASDNDAERAVSAALAMHEALAELALPQRSRRGATLGLRVGIGTGRVFAGRLAGTSRELGVVGEALTVATRLQQAAPTSTTLIGRDTHRLIAGLFRVEPVAGEPGGRDASWRVAGRAKDRAGLPPSDFLGLETKLVGRAAETSRLRELLDEVQSEQRPVLVTIVGAPGVGRSRLILEMARSLEGQERVAVMAAQCSPLGTDVSYGLAASLLRGRFHIHDDDPDEVIEKKIRRGTRMLAEGAQAKEPASDAPDLDEVASDLAKILGAREPGRARMADSMAHDDAAGQAKHRVAGAFARLVARVAARRPLVILCDDLQWADDASLDLLDDLLVRDGDAALLIACAARPLLYERRPLWGEGKASHVRLEVGQLGRRHIEEMARDRLRQVADLSPEVVRTLADRADGNALTLTETLHLLVDAGVIGGTDGSAWTVSDDRLGEIALPATIQGIVQARLDRVEPEARETLSHAAVIGRTFWEGAVETLGRAAAETLPHGRGPRHSAPQLERLRARQLIRARDTSAFPGEREYVFAESAIQEVAYATTSLKLRRALHGRAAAWLLERASGDAGAALVALHYDRAGDVSGALAAYARAAAHAADLGQNAEAVRHLERVREIHDETAGAVERADADRRMASWRERVSLRLELGEVLRRAGRLEQSEEAHEQARARILRVERRAGEAAAEKEATTWDARADVRVALTQKLRGETANARALVERAIARATEAGALVETPAMWAILAALLRREKNLDACRAAVVSGLGVARSVTTRDTRWSEAVSELLVSLGGVFYSKGLLVRAERCWRQAARVADETSGPASARFALNNVAVVRYARGDLAGARDTFLRVLAMNERVGDPYDLAVVHNNLAELELRLGDAPAALDHARRSVRVLEQLGAAADLPDAVKNLAEALLASGDPDAALDTGARALVLAEVGAGQVYLCDVIQALARIARTAAADAAATDARRDRVAAIARDLVRCLEAHTDVPSVAAKLAECRGEVASIGA